MSLNNTLFQEKSFDFERGGVAGLYLGLSFLGLSVECLVLYVIFKKHSSSLPPFYILLIAVMFTEIVSFLQYIFYVAPCVITGTQIYGILGGKIMGNFETVNFIALVATTFAIAVNRALSMRGGDLYKVLFTKQSCLAFAAVAWIFAAVVAAIDVSLECETKFFEKYYYFAEICKSYPPELTATSLTIYVGVYGVAVLYVYALIKLYGHHRTIGTNNDQVNANMSKRKRMLLFQAMCIWLSIVVAVISFRVIPVFLDGVPAVILTAFIVLGGYFVSPLCMLMFSSEIRKATVAVLFRSDTNVQFIHLNTTHSTTAANRNTSSVHGAEDENHDE